MTDKEIELLFKSIDNFDEFVEKICQLQNIKLKNDVEIVFAESEVEIWLLSKKVVVSYSTFEKIINELLYEDSSRVEDARGRRRKAAKEQSRDELIHIGDNQYKVPKEYIEHMLSASDVASAYEGYKRKLLELAGIFDRKGILTINQKKIFTREGLLLFLKAYGFRNVDKDLQLNKDNYMTVEEKRDKIKQVITGFEEGKLTVGEARNAINKLVGKDTDDYELLNYWRSEDLDTFVRRLAVDPIADWQTIDDNRAISLLKEIFEVWTSKPEIVDRNCEALEKRYRKSTGTVHEKIIVDNITDPYVLLEELKKETRIFL